MLDDLEPARHLAERVGEDLAVLADEDLGRLLAPRVEELTDAEEELGALRERRSTPAGEGVLRRLHCRVDLFHRREVDGAGLPAGGRVEDGPAAAGAALDTASPDPVRDAGGGGRVDGIGHAQ